MNYCSACGASITKQIIPGDDVPRYFCGACETVHYQNPNVVVGCIPIHKDQILLCKRAIEPRLGFWTIPGGFMENGETTEEGAMREANEEANTNLEIIDLITVYSIKHIDQVHICYTAKLLDLDYSPGIESLEVKLFHPSEIPWKEIAFTSTSFALKAYIKNVENGESKVHRGSFDLEKWKNEREGF